MNELKSHDLVDIQDYRGEVYLKREADEVIAGLKARIAKIEADVGPLMKNRGKLQKLNKKDAWDQHIFAYWPLVYRFTEEMAMATNSLGVEIPPETLEDAVREALADEILLKHVVDTAYQEMGFPCAFCNPLQLCISLPHLVTEPLAKTGEHLVDLVYDCVYESAKIACSLGFFIPGKQKI